jgi:hypothetical protein
VGLFVEGTDKRFPWCQILEKLKKIKLDEFSLDWEEGIYRRYFGSCAKWHMAISMFSYSVALPSRM